VTITKKTGTLFLFLFFLLLVSLPAASVIFDQYGVKLFNSFYRAGSLVFGGGHVVLPLLQTQVVSQGWVSNDMFLAGYGAAQAVPGPLFSFAAYLGAVSSSFPSGCAGAAIALAAIFLPGYLLIIGILPFWDSLRKFQKVRQAMTGVNASVVGILLATCYDPVMTSALHNVRDVCAAAAAFVLLVFCRWPSWIVVLLTVFGYVLFW
jgi:chromate transporter